MADVRARDEIDSVPNLGGPLGAPLPLGPDRLSVLGTIVVLTIAAGGLAWAASLWPSARVGAVLVGLIGADFGYFGLRRLYRHLHERASVRLCENGIVVVRGGVVRRVPFEVVATLTVHERKAWVGGVTAWRVTLRGERTPVSLPLRPHAKDRDAPAAFVAELRHRVTDVLRRGLHEGIPIVGKGWILDGVGLHVGAAPVVRLSALSRVEVRGRRVVVEGDAGKQALSLGLHSPNALVLHDVVADLLLQTPLERVRAEANAGRLLFEQRASRTERWLGGSFFAFPLASSLLLLFAYPNVATVWAGLIGVVLCAPLAWAGFRENTRVTRWHEYALTEQIGATVSVIPWSAVDRFRYWPDDYEGTIYAKFGAGTRRAIDWNGSTSPDDAYYERMKKRLADQVAARLEQRLARGERVSWTSTAQISPRGLHIWKKPWFRPALETFLSFDDELELTIKDFGCRIHRAGEPVAVAELFCGEENFWPGLVLFRRLATRATERSA